MDSQPEDIAALRAELALARAQLADDAATIARQNLEIAKLKHFEQELFRFMDTRKPEVLTLVREKKQLGDDVKQALDAALQAFKREFVV